MVSDNTDEIKEDEIMVAPKGKGFTVFPNLHHLEIPQD